MTESPTGRIIGRNARLSIDGKEIKSVTMDIDFSGIEMRELWDRDIEAERDPRRRLLEVGERWTEVREFMESDHGEG